MFRKTDPNQGADLFYDLNNLLIGRSARKFNDPEQWHNKFFKMVTSKIDEELFRPLYVEDGKKDGRPIASVRAVVAMIILKEGFGCSDEELGEKCDFDMLTRAAIGINNICTAAPSMETYYKFRSRLVEYNKSTGKDLMEDCFKQVTHEQVLELNISGKSIRMDSKLIGSNIANLSRYELIQRTLVKFLKEFDLALMGPEAQRKAAEYLAENPEHTVYENDSDTVNNRLLQLGEFIHRILILYSLTSESYILLHRVFNEQYKVEDGKVILRNRKEIAADSLQSPDDPDATYRDKNGKKTKGYSTNITETLPEKDDKGNTVKPSLIVGAQTEPASTADNSFVEEAVKTSQEVTGDKVEEIFADGAYQGPDNRKFAEKENIQLKTGKMQGKSRFYLVRWDGDKVSVTDTVTGEIMNAEQVKTRKEGKKKWRIPDPDIKGKWRYFDEKAVERSEVRQNLLELPPEELAKRNNVEAAMFQYSFHTRNNKTRYRGLLKHRMHTYTRCMWMNFRRILIWSCGLFFTLITVLQKVIDDFLGTRNEEDGIFEKIRPLREVAFMSADNHRFLRLNYFLK